MAGVLVLPRDLLVQRVHVVPVARGPSPVPEVQLKSHLMPWAGQHIVLPSHIITTITTTSDSIIINTTTTTMNP